MVMNTRRALFVMALIALASARLAGADSAAGGTSGRYMTNDSYFLDVTFFGTGVTTVEPNKTTTFRKQNATEYLYTDPNKKIFGIRVIDGKTLQAFRVDIKQPPTKLTLMPAYHESDDAAPTGDEKFNAIAQKYLALAQSDPDDAQAWSACGAVAMQRSLLSVEDADVYAVQAARMLRMMDAAQSPCAEVISAKNWAEAGAE